VCWHAFEADVTRKHNAAIVFKRAHGQGRIRAIEGLQEFVARNRQWVCAVDLLPVGAQRRDWTQTLVSDGYVLVRHPEWGQALRIAKDAADNIRLFAG
jgi:hypothetical protein